MKRIWILLVLLILLGCLTGCAAAAPAAESADPSACVYTVCAYAGGSGEAIAGVVVNFCSEDSCTPVTTGEDGTAVFTGPAAKYHVQIIQVPEGWEAEGDVEWETEAHEQTFRIPFAEVGQ